MAAPKAEPHVVLGIARDFLERLREFSWELNLNRSGFFDRL
jgi:hypothetical protein